MTGYILYGRHETGSIGPEATLAEAGADYRCIAATKNADGSPPADLLMLNPRGQVPVLVLPDGSVMTESPAIMIHVADAHPASRLAPSPGTPLRAQHDRWLSFLQANIYEGELRRFYSARYTTDPDGAAGVEAAALAYVEAHYRMVEGALPATAYWFGPDVTVVDLYLWMLAGWFDPAWLARECPRIAALTARVAARPAVALIQTAHYG
jgi:glutathione S-transferase